MKSQSEKQAYVYILKCADDSLYCGFAYNVQKRIEMHNNKKGAKYTKTRLPVKLVYTETCQNKSAALKREHEIKKLTREQKLKLLEKNEIF